MSESKKTHSKDYLLEYEAKKDTPKWLVFLIQKVIDTNAKISESDKNTAFQKLLNENEIETDHTQKKIKDERAIETEVVVSHKKEKLTLDKITHIKGVNALVHNQPIVLSPTCTIVYGLNGTGKSGYFRIINELAGGTKAKDILGNIHLPADASEVNIDFSLNSKKQKTFEWNNETSRGTAPFNQIKVFDAEYLPIFLDEHESSANIEPLGLNFFKTITTTIDEFKGRLEQAQIQKQSTVPDLQCLIEEVHSPDLKGLLKKTSLTRQEEKQLADIGEFSKEDAGELTQLRKEVTILEKNNTEDSRKVLNQEKKELDNLKNHLSNIKRQLEEQTKKVSSSVIDYLAKKKIRDTRAKEFEMLKNIPSQNTDEWQTFIESAKEYGELIDGSVLNKEQECIYCHQALQSKDSVKLVQAYTQYLDDQSQQKFKDATTKISELTTECQNVGTSFLFSDSVSSVLGGLKNNQKQDYKTLVNQVLGDAEEQRSVLENTLKDKTSISQTFTLDLFGTDKKLEEISENMQREIDGLQQSDTEKAGKIDKLKTEINKLEDKQNVSNWKTKIETHFLIWQVAEKYKSVNRAISTKGITDIGSKAHNELLTASIRKAFIDELKDINKDIDVQLIQTGAGKGSVRTTLKVLNNDVASILSEGEQKAVGLALFLAEAKEQNEDSPIVFDDPVTSVDHEIAHRLAEKLIQLSSNRQIIIFTHNKLFYDSLVFWTNNSLKAHHLCVNYGNGNKCKDGHHVYTYQVEKESKDKTGKIFEKQNESCEYYINKAEREMKVSYAISSVSGHLKSAIEHYIDERILNGQGLVKDQKVKDHIEWEKLKKLNPDTSVINQLRLYWEELSNRGTHLSAQSSENPLGKKEFNEIIAYLKQ